VSWRFDPLNGTRSVLEIAEMLRLTPEIIYREAERLDLGLLFNNGQRRLTGRDLRRLRAWMDV
jgi:hypothetical protein